MRLKVMYNYLLTQNLGSGTDFEEHIAHLLRRNGFTAQLTGNNDKGVDIIAQSPTAGNPKFLIQCKYQHATLNLAPIQEIFTGVALRGYIGHPVVFSTSHITAKARESAEALGVEIIAFPELKKLELAESGQAFAGQPLTGLAGILFGLVTGNSAYANQCSSHLQDIKYLKIKTQPSKIVQPTPEKQLKRQIIEETYRQISLHEQELQNLHFQESQHRQMINKLKKEAELQILDAL